MGSLRGQRVSSVQERQLTSKSVQAEAFGWQFDQMVFQHFPMMVNADRNYHFNFIACHGDILEGAGAGAGKVIIA